MMTMMMTMTVYHLPHTDHTSSPAAAAGAGRRTATHSDDDDDDGDDDDDDDDCLPLTTYRSHVLSCCSSRGWPADKAR